MSMMKFCRIYLFVNRDLLIIRMAGSRLRMCKAYWNRMGKGYISIYHIRMYMPHEEISHYWITKSRNVLLKNFWYLIVKANPDKHHFHHKHRKHQTLFFKTPLYLTFPVVVPQYYPGLLFSLDVAYIFLYFYCGLMVQNLRK